MPGPLGGGIQREKIIFSAEPVGHSAMARFRVRLLRVHGGLLMVLGLANAALSTWGVQTGKGLMGFLAEHRLGHAGLVQAYLLAALLGFLLIRGARASDPRFWNRVGACVHLGILPAYVFHWDFFAEVAPAGAAMRNAIGIHLTFLTLECVAGFSRASDAG